MNNSIAQAEKKKVGPTAGPWAIDDRGERQPKIVNANYDTYIADVRQSESGLSHEEAQANARLIAASPDLLAACREADQCLLQLMDDLAQKLIDVTTLPSAQKFTHIGEEGGAS